MSVSARSSRRVRLVFALFLQGIVALCCPCEDRVERTVRMISAPASGSELVVVLADDGSDKTPTVLAISVASGKVLWNRDDLPLAYGAAFSPSGKTVALAVDRPPKNDSVAQIVDAASGKVLESIRQQDAPGYFPAKTQELAFSPDGSILYGLGEQYLYAWDTVTSKLLWTRDVPGGLPDNKLDHADSFALSADGRELGLNRFGLVYLLQAGPTKPRGATELPGDINNVGDQPAFSPDGHYFVTGFGYNSSFAKLAAHYTRGGLLWRLNGSKPVPVKDCGGYFAWTYNPEVFACQSYTGTHLRNVHDPNKDIGTAGPISDLPFVKVGNSVWAAAYKITDWKDPTKPLPLTLVELGTGKRLTIMLPGRSGPAGAKP